MEKYFTDNILLNIKSISSFYLALHFYESVIFSLIKRRETVNKKNTNLIKEISERDVVKNESEKEETNIMNVDNINDIVGNVNDDKTVSYTPDNIDADKT